MTQTLGKTFLIPFLIAVFTGLVLVPGAADANREARGGGTQKAAAGGGASANNRQGAGTNSGRQGGAQVNNTNADSRSNQVRGSSVNNVNKNVNVNVQNGGGGGCCNNNNNWDNDNHPVAAMAAIAGTAAIIGNIVNQPPSNCVPVNHGGMVYQQCGSTWYQPQGSQYVVVNPPY